MILASRGYSRANISSSVLSRLFHCFFVILSQWFLYCHSYFCFCLNQSPRISTSCDGLAFWDHHLLLMNDLLYRKESKGLVCSSRVVYTTVYHAMAQVSARFVRQPKSNNCLLNCLFKYSLNLHILQLVHDRDIRQPVLFF